MSGALGRRVPETWEHVSKYGLAEIGLPLPPAGTEKSLGLPWWWKSHDQGPDGSCVGFGCSAMMSVTNHKQRLLATGRDITFRYESVWLYHEAQFIDEWADTPPGEGTSVRAGCDILRNRGHRRVQNGVAGVENLANGISANRWATTVDEMRSAIYANVACAIGVNWYSKMDSPYVLNNEHWVDVGGYVRGGHCLCVYRMSDRRQAFMLMNSWGAAWPPCWISYEDMQRLIDEAGEATVITDR